MRREIDETHDPELRSWVQAANTPGSAFPLQNLPFGIFRPRRAGESWHVGVAIGDQILDLAACQARGALEGLAAELVAACGQPDLAGLMALGSGAWGAMRMRMSELLSAGARDREAVGGALVPQADAEMGLPARSRSYTDFYASVFHATNVGRLFRPENPLLPNFKYVPIAYHGRSSSLLPSGTAIRRPKGQRKPPDAQVPSYGPSRLLDYELEVGFYVGPGNPREQPLSIDDAEAHVFGLCLVNDWSARDVQAWEYQPLGPFLSKSFATSVSPWVVTLEALAPFRCPAYERPEGDPAPLPHLSSEQDRQSGGLDLSLEVELVSESMRAESGAPHVLSKGSFRHMYWTLAQMMTHHTSNGCNLEPGDLVASGTVSGPEPHSRGCLLELTARGAEPVALPNGEQRQFLEDGDEVVLRGRCERAGYVGIGLGECRGQVLPTL